MNSWNGLDFFIFLIFAVNTLLGMSRGAGKEIISLMCLSLALIFTIKFSVPLANFFNSSPLINDVVSNRNAQTFMLQTNAGQLSVNLLHEIFYSISLLICFVGTFSVGEAALSYSGFRETISFPYAALNRKVGAALGCLRGYCLALILILILAFHVYKNDWSNKFISGSYFVHLFQNAAYKLDNLVSQQQPENYQEIYKDKNLFNENNVYQVLKRETSTSS